MYTMTPKYEVIHQTILRQIESGVLRPDDRLPAEEELAQEYGVSLITVRRAMTELSEDGVIRRVKGQGSFVKRRQLPEKKETDEKLIAFLLNHDNNAAVSVTRIVTGVQDVLYREGYRMLLDWNITGNSLDRACVDRMINNRVDGFIIYPYNPVKDVDTYKYIESTGIPYVLIDRYPVDKQCDYVGSDNISGGRLAAKTLIEYGHRKIACCVDLFFLSSEKERYAGFLDMCREAGAEHMLIRNEDRKDLPRLIKEKKITGLFCASDRIAARTIQLLEKHGVSVPDDVSVIGFDDCFFDSSVNTQFTSIRQDFKGLGALGAESLLSRVSGARSGLHTKQLLEVTLTLREASLRRI